MIRSLASLTLLVLAPSLAWAQDKAVGVYLPVSVDDRDTQFKFAEALAAALSKATGTPVSARSFARWEDFSKAAADGSLAYGVSEALVLAGARGDFTPVGLAATDGEVPGQRWAIIAERRTSVADLAGKRLAVIKGPGNLEGQFLSNVLFGGELGPRHFQLVPVPSVESATRAVSAKHADAALVPLALVPKGFTVLFRSVRLPGPVLVGIKGNAAELGRAVPQLGAVAPLGRFSPAQPDVVSDLRRRVGQSPGGRLPFIVESPTWRPDEAILPAFTGIGPTFPSFVQFVEASKETPDD